MQVTQASRCSVTTGAGRKCSWWRADPEVEKVLRALAPTLVLLSICLAAIAAEGCVLMTGLISLMHLTMLPIVFAVAYEKCLELFTEETIMKGERKQETKMARG